MGNSKVLLSILNILFQMDKLLNYVMMTRYIWVIKFVKRTAIDTMA